MSYYCPNCGSSLEAKYNFCPSCGYNLENLNIADNKTEIQSEEEYILCGICGEENAPGAEHCSGCGARLTGKEKVHNRTVKKIEKNPQQQKKVESKAPKAKQNVARPAAVSASDSKSLDTVKTFSIIGSVLVAALVILYMAGVFETGSGETTVTGTPPPNTQAPGVNLANIQQINQLEEQIKNNPKDTEALLSLAHLKNDSGMYEQAIVNYKQYLDQNPSDPDARIDMGVCYYNLGNYTAAIAEMEKALTYKSDHQIGHLNLGIVNLAAGNLEVSKDWLKKAVALNPNSDVGKRAKELLESH